ncbi:MAG: response regulator [Chloroflexales bacterium]|nr:response regulator [Chloroflexales bacterium]
MYDLLDTAPCGFAITADDGLILLANTTLLHMLGYERGSLLGQHFDMLLSTGSRVFVRLYVFPRLKLEGKVEELYITLRAHSGVDMPVLANAVRREHEGGIVYDWVVVSMRQRDQFEQDLLQARKTAEAAHRAEEQARTEAERANHAKDEFLASMSHELRTPLNAVLGLSEALREQAYGPLNERQARALKMIEESGRHLLDLITDILDVAKVGAGKMDLEFTPVSVEQVCAASLRMVRQAALKKQITVQHRIDPQVSSMWADGRRLKQILTNLLSNAVKFTPGGGSVGLEVHGDAGQEIVCFAVWDTGIGIAPEQLGRLFQPFVQLDSRLSRQHEGTGLGLALVYSMAALQGGSVAVESTVGAGSRFTVTLPWRRTDGASEVASQAPSVPAEPQPAEPRLAARRMPMILLVEDNEGNGELVVDYLGSLGYDILWAHSGAEALALAHEAHPAIILMDIQMPDMDGFEVTRRLRAEPTLRKVPIIAVTALAMPGDRERCLRAGADDYMTKPVILADLRKAIDRWLRPREGGRG